MITFIKRRLSLLVIISAVIALLVLICIIGFFGFGSGSGSGRATETAIAVFTVTRTVAAIADVTETAEAIAQATEVAEANAEATAAAAEVAAPTRTAAAATTQAEVVAARQTADAQLISGSILAQNATATAAAIVAAATSQAATAGALANVTPTPETTENSTPTTATKTPTPLPTHTPPASPTRTITPTAMPLTETPLPVVEAAENTEISDTDKLGQLNIEYPINMSPGSSDTVIVKIFIPVELVSLVPVAVERVDIPQDLPAIIGQLGSHSSTIPVREKMRVELSSPTFEIESQSPLLQLVDLHASAQPTFWVWAVVAPSTIGSHVVTVRVYRGTEESPVWVGSLKIAVVGFASTPTSAPGPMTYFNTPGGMTITSLVGLVFAGLLIGLVIFFIARNSFPVIGTESSYRRALTVQSKNLAQLEEQAAKYGMDVPLKITNEIEFTKDKIAQIEAKLALMNDENG